MINDLALICIKVLETYSVSEEEISAAEAIVNALQFEDGFK